MANGHRSASPPAGSVASRSGRPFAGASLGNLMERIPDARALSFLRALATGWNAGVQKLLRLPASLFFQRDSSGTPYTLYSAEESFAALEVLRALESNQPLPSPLPRYAILITEKSSLINFLLIDSERRIIVRTTLKSFHSEDPKEWQVVANAIREALKAAEAQPDGIIVRS